MRIIGIDPGSRITGYGVIEFHGSTLSHLASGCIRTAGGPFPDRLREIFEGLGGVIGAHAPDEMAAEQVFMHRNAASAIKLGQARGAALLAGVVHHIPVYEYSPNQIKQAVTGRGHAAKTQVQHMMRMMLHLDAHPEPDASDALAVAVCHGNTRITLARIERSRELAGSARA